MIPLRRPEASSAQSPQAAEARRSTPSFIPNPGSRPRSSTIPAPSVMPGMSMHVHSVLLSAVAGYVDAAGFIALIGLFPAHITGELVGEALAFTSGHIHEHMARLWVLPVFVGSVMTATLVARARRRKGQRALTGLLVLVTGALVMFSASDALSRVLHEGPHLAFLLSGGSAVAAMAFQNSLMRESLAASCPTTVMTGNLTQVIIDVVDHFTNKIMHPGKRDRRPRARLGPTAISLAAFMSCAVLGGFLARCVGSLSVALPAIVTLSLAFLASYEDRKRHAVTAQVAKINAAPLLPTFDVWPDSLRKHGVSEPERAAAKRTASGTQLSTRFRAGK